MARNKKNKLILVPIILLVALAAFAYMILYNGEAVVNKAASPNVEQKITSQVLANIGQFKVTQEDMNAAVKLYFKGPISKGDITLMEVNTKMENGEILIEAPFTYNTIDLLFSSRGKLELSNGEITYNADYFKIGKLPLPKKLVMGLISKQSNDDFYVEGNLIKIKTDKLPFKIKSLEIKDNELVGIVGLKGLSTSFGNVDSLSEIQIDNKLAAAKQKIQSAIAYMNATQRQQANVILNKLEEVNGQSLEVKKQALNYANNIINNVTK